MKNMRYTTDIFIEKAKSIHGDKYDYSKVEYVNSKTKVCIICPVHGEFWQDPGSHIVKKYGCRFCGYDKLSKSRRYDKSVFVQRAKRIHGDKYDYSKVEYVNSYTKVCIICPKHGKFWQTPINHVDLKHNCALCGKEKRTESRRLNTDIFIRKAKTIHGNKYDYSKSEYTDSKTKVCIICPKHGEFWQSPGPHTRGQGCPKCNNERKTKTFSSNTQDFISKVEQLHGDKYDYSKVKYINAKTKVCIICPKHGEFWQTPINHLRGSGCKICQDESMSKTTDEFIQQSIRVHDGKYDYSKVEYVNWGTKVCIICPKHGEFWQTPGSHLQGSNCPKCKTSHGENIIRDVLNECNIEFFEQYRFDDCRNKLPLPFDFYLPVVNTCIEYDGVQHFEPVGFFGGEDAMANRKKHDTIKENYCNSKGIKLVRISYKDNIRNKLIKEGIYHGIIY